MIKTWQDLIIAFGGPYRFADAIDVSQVAALQMSSHNSVNSRHWRKIVTVAPHAGVTGVTYEFLAGLKTGRFRPQQPTQESANQVA